MVPFYRWQGRDLLLFCHLQPGASSTEFSGYHGDRVKIRVHAPPIEGKANRLLRDFIATEFAVAKSHVSIENGDKGRQKSVLIRQPKRIPPQLEPMLALQASE